MSKQPPQINFATLDRIKQDWFEPYLDQIGIVLNRTNMILDNRFLFGCFDTARADLFNLTHEMAHMIEIDQRRCHYPNWNFRYGTAWSLFGQSGFEMATTQAVEREIRTAGIQLVLNRFYNLPADPFHETERDSYFMASLAKWLQNYERYADPTIAHAMQEESAFLHIERRIISAYQTHTMENLKKAWQIKMIVLRRKRRRGCWLKHNVEYLGSTPMVYA